MDVFQIQRDTGLWYSVEYASFSVGPESDKYRLSVSGCSGDVGDALAAPVNPDSSGNGMRFSTRDQDNDMKSSGSCARSYGGWWFNYCSRSKLTAKGSARWNAETDESIADVVFARMLVKLA